MAEGDAVAESYTADAAACCYSWWRDIKTHLDGVGGWSCDFESAAGAAAKDVGSCARLGCSDQPPSRARGVTE